MRPRPNEDIEEFAKRITAIAWSNGEYVEREACAKEADKRLHDFTMLTSNPPQSGAAFSISQAIRARSNSRGEA